LERSAVKPEVAELIGEAAQGTPPARGKYDSVSQEKARFKSVWRFTKNFNSGFTLYSLSRRESRSSFVGSQRSGQGEEEVRTSNRSLVPALGALLFA
jgi:hypothetical protein